jgi:hypothetical protein
LTVPGFCIAAHKAGVGNNYLTITQATALGFGISVSIVSRKKIIKSFKAAKDFILDAPAIARNSFAYCYAKETIRENQKAIRSAFTRKDSFQRLLS